MALICSAGLGIPKYELSQTVIKNMVENLFPISNEEKERLLPIFKNAKINKRQFVVEPNWLLEKHSFGETNKCYMENAIHYSLQAIDHCLTNNRFLQDSIPYEAIDMIVFVSSTGIATPSIDAHILNERPFREDVMRMPLWGLGCAGGAIGLSRASDWITAYPDKTVLVVCCELCSLTFQKNDQRKSNIVGTALFGDGVSAALLVGKQSPYFTYSRGVKPEIKKVSSYTKKDSISIMGWNISELGFEVIFSKSIPSLVKTLWKNHVQQFLQSTRMDVDQIHSFIAHPGGKKVMEAMEDSLSISYPKIKHSYNVLEKHGNMSSATILYVLKEWMKDNIITKEKSIISALGPGFSSELLLLEWS